MSTLNLGILAHVDAGKTSLTERLLYAAGVIDEIGSVDDGSTQTDSLELERQRGITIKSAVVSFAIGDLTVNLIDTPGHPDFIAEVERVLNVLDGAVLVVSAVEGVQAQTRVLMRTLARLRIPTLIFVNKIDRGGARDAAVLRAMGEKLSPAVIAMGSAAGLGTRAARYAPFTAADQDFAARLLDLLAERDDSLLAAYVTDESAVSHGRLLGALAEQTRRALVHPVFFGSAITGAGVAELMAGIRSLLPAARGDDRGPVSGTVFKVERGPAGEKIAYARMFSGAVRVRDRLWFGDGAGGDGRGGGKVTAISVFGRGGAARSSCLRAGQIGKLRGLGEIRIGDAIGSPDPPPAPGPGPSRRPGRGHFAPPTLETVITPSRRADKGALHAALSQLAEQDPLINLRQDDLRNEISVSLYGEVQKEVIAATLAGEFGIEVGFRESTTICIERPAGTGEAAEFIATPPNAFLATVGLRVEPGPPGSGVRYQVAGDRLGTMPVAFFAAVEETVHATLRQGLHGWQVTDVAVTLTHTGYWPRQSHAHAHFDKSMSSTAGDFRGLTPLVLMAALAQAGTTVLEPLHRFAIEAPADTAGPLLPALVRLGGTPRGSSTRGAECLVEGDIPAARVHELERQLPGLTRGEGVLDSAFDRYQPVRAEIPDRARTDQNPLDRKAYLLRVTRRV